MKMKLAATLGLAFGLSLVCSAVFAACGSAPCNGVIYHVDAPLYELSSGSGDGVSKTATWDDLRHRRFVFVSLDGKELPASIERIPEIEFNEDNSINGRFCNQFRGPAELQNGFLTAGQLAMTMMACFPEELNELERTVPALLKDGVFLRLEGDKLIMEQSGRIVVYKSADWVR